jgi:uncharacterized protein GlcG (DUF336 family)
MPPARRRRHATTESLGYDASGRSFLPGTVDGGGHRMYVHETKRLTLAGARKMMAAAMAKAEAAHVPIAVAVVDAGGHMILLERMDDGRFHTVHSATTKAICAASNRRPTSARGAQGQDLDTVHALGLALAAGPERWTAMEGGYPIIVDGHCVGGIGVSGGTWEFDDAAARLALEAIGATIDGQ